ncbi:MAG TPA: hypothetical protein VKO42_02060, partial [Patescibacteria group bacterium]|nr:hypothetical protein [Patescibacteria group bacterium]
NPATKLGTGFGFSNFNEFALFRAIVRAIETFGHKEDWEKLVKRSMQQSNSWEIPAKKYMKLFRWVLKTNGKSVNGK